MTKEDKKRKETKKTKKKEEKREELRKKLVVKRKLEETFPSDRSSASQCSSDSEHSVVLFLSDESSPGSASDDGNVVEKSPVAKQVERCAIAKAVETQPILARVHGGHPPMRLRKDLAVAWSDRPSIYI